MIYSIYITNWDVFFPSRSFIRGGMPPAFFVLPGSAPGGEDSELGVLVVRGAGDIVSYSNRV